MTSSTSLSNASMSRTSVSRGGFIKRRIGRINSLKAKTEDQNDPPKVRHV